MVEGEVEVCVEGARVRSVGWSWDVGIVADDNGEREGERAGIIGTKGRIP